MGKLTDTFVRAAKPGKFEDGDGLRLIVTENRKRWTLRYTLGDRRPEMTLGQYPDLKLSDARRLASEARGKLAAGVDPLAARKATKQAQKPLPTFGEIAELVIAAEEAKGLPPKGLLQLKRYLGPTYVGKWLNKPVNSINSVAVLELLTPLRREKPEATRKLYPQIRKVFAHARIRLRDDHGIDFQNPAYWDDLKAMGYAAPERLTRGSHPSAHFSILPEVMAAIRASDHRAARMLELVILTNVRTDAVRHAKAEDFDLQNAVWTIPPAHLKDKKTRGEKPFRVPLTSRAVEVVHQFMPENKKGLLFKHEDGSAFSDAYMLNVLRTLNGKPPKWTDKTSGRAIVVHGFRASFQTWAAQTQKFSSDIVREAMGHVIGNQVDRVYARDDLMEQRRPLMENWHRACYPTEDNIVAFPAGRQA